MHPPLESGGQRTFGVKRGREAEGFAPRPGATTGHGATPVERRSHRTSHTRHVGANHGSGSVEFVPSFASHVPYTTYPLAARPTVALHLLASSEAPTCPIYPIHLGATNGQPQHVGCNGRPKHFWAPSDAHNVAPIPPAR